MESVPISPPRPAMHPRPQVRLRRGSVAAILFRLVLVAAVAFGGYLFWQKKEQERIAAEAEALEAAKRAEAEAAEKKKNEVADIEFTAKEKPATPTTPKVEVASNQVDKQDFGPRRTSGFVESTDYSEFDYTTPPLLDTTDEGRKVLSALEASRFKFTPVVKDAYLKLVQAKVIKDLRALKKSVSDDFLSWTRNDPVVAATVYGGRAQPVKVVLLLQSLEQDLGRKVVREEYKQLALATAYMWAHQGWDAEITARKPLVLTVPGDPRKPVDTKAKDRPLDRDDHIVNFIKDHPPIEAEVVGGMKEMMDELKYDAKGVAKSTTKVGPKVKRPVIPADILASRALQQEFNEYMKSHGHDVSIDCGNHIVYPSLIEALPGDKRPEIVRAYKMFRDAMERKGLLALRDAPPNPAEMMAFLMRNDDKVRSATAKYKQPNLHFPIKTAPWPVMTLLVRDAVPLRERDEILKRYIDRGELHTYGEYLGPIAQDFEGQSARRLSPYDFGYGSVQMMLKDGGVCGTMATIAVRSYNALGRPAMTAGQPGHCALMAMSFDAKNKRYGLGGEQFVTGDETQTWPHVAWALSETDEKRCMVYHQADAWAVNAGFDNFLETLVAWQIYRAMPESAKKANGLTFLADAATRNPFNLNLSEAAWSLGGTPKQQLDYFRTVETAYKSKAEKAGAPKDGHFHNTLRAGTIKAIDALPRTEDPILSKEIEDIRKKIPPPPKAKD